MSSECNIVFDWDNLRDWVLRSSFPSLIPKVRADIVRHLAGSEDTIYGISKATGYPIQSVLKALKVLIEKGYVECERKESKKRKVQANVCKLTELGKLAAIALSPGIELDVLITQQSLYDEIVDTISSEWLKNENLRNVYREAFMITLAHSNIENSYQELLKIANERRKQPIILMYTIVAYIVAAQAKVAIFELLQDFINKEEKEPYTVSYVYNVFEYLPTQTLTLKLKDSLKKLMKCDEEIRRILIKTVKAYLKQDIIPIFADYIHRILFLIEFEKSREELVKLVDELEAVNEKILKGLGIYLEE